MEKVRDFTLRPICFGISNEMTNELAKKIGADTFKKYEYALYTLAQFARLVYSDSGIIWHLINLDILGKSNDLVNSKLNELDAKFFKERKEPIKSQKGDGNGRPMESYSLSESTKDSDLKYGTYISSPDDVTCLIVQASKIVPNANSIFDPPIQLFHLRDQARLLILKRIFYRYLKQ